MSNKYYGMTEEQWSQHCQDFESWLDNPEDFRNDDHEVEDYGSKHGE